MVQMRLFPSQQHNTINYLMTSCFLLLLEMKSKSFHIQNSADHVLQSPDVYDFVI